MRQRTPWIIQRLQLVFPMLVMVLSVAACSCNPSHPPKFKEGDVAIARHFTSHPQYEGTPVKVSGGLRWRWIKELQGNALCTYEIETVDGVKLAAQEFQLQPKK